MLSPKTARSQIVGGVVWGIGMALEEESLMDNHYVRSINHDLAEYHLPVNADIQDIDLIFVDEEDTIVNPLGVKGFGEIGIVGVAAAICNAIFHATGKRLRYLPITLDKLIKPIVHQSITVKMRLESRPPRLTGYSLTLEHP